MNNETILQLIESLSHQDTPFPDALLKIRPLLDTREQKIIDLLIKFQEIMVLIEEIQE